MIYSVREMVGEVYFKELMEVWNLTTKRGRKALEFGQVLSMVP